MSFAGNMSKNVGKNKSKNISSKYSKNVLDHAKQSTTDALKIDSKRTIQKTAEATGDLIDNKTADRIIEVSKTSPKNISNRNTLRKIYTSRTKTHNHWWSKIKDRKLLMI